MAARLVSYSKATDEFNAEGLTDLQELIAFRAKVFNPFAQINTETSERLIKYLIKHPTLVPSEMVNAVIEIETTRDIAHSKLLDIEVLHFKNLVKDMQSQVKWVNIL